MGFKKLIILCAIFLALLIVGNIIVLWQKQPQTEYLNAEFNGLLAITTIVLAAIAIWQAVISRQQAVISRDSRDIASDTAHRQLRAYMGARVDDDIQIDGKGEYLDFKILFRNDGETPAYRVHYVGRAEILKYRPKPEDFKVEEMIRRMDDYYAQTHTVYAPRIIPRGGEFGYPVRLSIDDNQRAQIKLGDERIYVWGVLRYWDAFDKKQQTKFRFMFGGSDCLRYNKMFWGEEPDANEAT
jgi:hypothetical protein